MVWHCHARAFPAASTPRREQGSGQKQFLEAQCWEGSVFTTPLTLSPLSHAGHPGCLRARAPLQRGTGHPPAGRAQGAHQSKARGTRRPSGVPWRGDPQSHGSSSALGRAPLVAPDSWPKATAVLCASAGRGRRAAVTGRGSPQQRRGCCSSGDELSFTVSLSQVISRQCQLAAERRMDRSWWRHHGDGVLGRCTDSPSAAWARSKCWLWAETTVPSVRTGRAPVCLCQRRGDPPVCQGRGAKALQGAPA